MTRRRWGLTLLVLVGLQARVVAGQGPAERRFTVEDVLRTEGLSAVVPAPDGQLIAVVIQRSRGPIEIHAHPGLGGNVRGDIWLVRSDGSQLHALTDGARDGAGYWNPVWSPDGRWLAMLSTEGGDAVRAWLWERSSNTLRPADARAIDIWTTTDPNGEEFQPLVWLRRSVLLLPLLPIGAHASFDPIGEAEKTAIKLWAAARAGIASTASVLDTEQPPALGLDGVEELVAIDVDSDQARTIAEFPRDPTTSGVRSVVPSPTGDWVALLTSQLERPEASTPLSRSMNRHLLGIVQVAGRDSAVRWMRAISAYRSGEDFRTIIRWSPDGAKLAVAGMQTFADKSQPSIFVIDVNSLTQGAGRALGERAHARTTRVITDLVVQDARWITGGHLLVRGSRTKQEGWWAADDGLPLRRFPFGIGEASEVITSGRAGTFYVSGDSGVRLVDWATGDRRPLSVKLLGGSTRIMWTDAGHGPLSPATRILVEVSRPSPARVGGPKQYFDLKFEGKRPSIALVATVSSPWVVRTYLPSSRQVLMVRANALVATASADREITLVHRNAFLDAVPHARRLLISYRATSGDSLHAVLLLPPWYHEGERYPMVTWVYAGMVYTDTSQVHADPQNASWLNLLLLASQGYAVLCPSMPVGGESDAGRDMLLSLSAGVMPAVDRVIDMGIADPQRLAVMGQSFGGYSTLGLVTLTRRFRSAIAIAGISDFVSQYGTFRPWDRFRADAHLTLANQKMIEAGQGRLGAPVWSDPLRFVINSPVFHLQRVETPVLLVQGDQDFEGIQQSEEYFTGLYRLNKRARFIRYWGDEHSLDSPANIRDLWSRVFEWLDETLNVPPPQAIR